MRGASKVLCIITGIFDVFACLATAITALIGMMGGLNYFIPSDGDYAGSGMPSSGVILSILIILLLFSFVVCLAGAISAFSAAGGSKGGCIATIVFGFMGENLLAILGGIFGVIAINRERREKENR